MKKFFAVLTTAALAVGLALIAVAAPASAHDNAVSGSVACVSNVWTVTWTITNDWTTTETITSDNKNLVLPADLAAKKSVTVTETVSAPTNETLTVTGTWPDSPNPYVGSNQGSITTADFTGKCATPTPSAVESTGLYIYQKKDAAQPASWENSLQQTRLFTWDGWSFKTATTGLPAALPSWVCGPGWGVQQDEINGAQSLFPLNIQYPNDGGFASGVLHASQHNDLTDLVTSVPACTTTVTPVPPTVTTATTCGTTGSVVLAVDSATIHYVLTSFDTTTGNYVITATAQGNNVFAGNVTTTTLTGTAGAAQPTCTILPHDPTATDIVCTNDVNTDTISRTGGTITVTPVTGVTYTITGGPTGSPITPVVIVSKGTTPIVTAPLKAGTYVVTPSGANLEPKATSTTLTIVDKSGDCLTTLAKSDGIVGAGDQTCSSGKLSSGYITVFLDPATLSYSLNGTTLGAKTFVAPGTYTVDFTAAPGSSLLRPSATVTVHAVSAACGDLKTLALGDGGTLASTGGTLVGAGFLSAAALLLIAGGLLIQRSRRQRGLL